RVLWLAGDKAAAQAECNKALELVKGKKLGLKRAEVIRGIAETYIESENKDLDQALLLLSEAITLDPKNEDNYLLQGDALYAKTPQDELTSSMMDAAQAGRDFKIAMQDGLLTPDILGQFARETANASVEMLDMINKIKSMLDIGDKKTTSANEPPKFDASGAFGQGAISQTPTTRLRVEIEINGNEAIGSLREFGLFGGTATAIEDSGLMINWVAHPLIEKTDDLVLNRLIELDFIFA
ncbi:hypothetical protein EB001_16820, partial [bacterium]|nr:hypothetical protein [bacterium]